jgi:tight adherence protein B
VAAALTGGSVALLLSGRSSLPRPRSRSTTRLTPALVGLAAAGTAWALWSSLSVERFVLAALAGGVLAGVARMIRRARAAAAAERRSEQVLAVCEAMASDLGAGQPPLVTLARAAEEWPELAPVAVAAQMGADVPSVLRGLADAPGAGRLRTLAATWQVAHDTGSGLADAIAQAAEAIAEDRRTVRLVAAELAAARATARTLAVLPLGVLWLGSGVGGDPIGFLIDTAPGLVCLGTGLALCFAGLVWLERIADRVLHR